MRLQRKEEPRARDSSCHFLHAGEAGVLMEPDALIYKTWPPHRGSSDRETLLN